MNQGEVDNDHLTRDLRVSSSEELLPDTLEALQRAVKEEGSLSSGTAVMADLFAAASGHEDLGLLRRLNRRNAHKQIDQIATNAGKTPRRRSGELRSAPPRLPPDVLRFRAGARGPKEAWLPAGEQQQSGTAAMQEAPGQRIDRWGRAVQGVYLAALGLLLAVCGTALLFLPSAWAIAPDIFWDIAAMALGAIVLFKKHPAPAMLFALIGAAFGESIFRAAGLNLPAFHLETLAPVGMWALLLLPALRLSRTGTFLVRAAVVANVAAFGSAFLGFDTSTFWVASFALATFSLTQRSFAIGAFSHPQITLSACALIPWTLNLILSKSGVPLVHGSAYVTASNLWITLAPLGCILFLVAGATKNSEVKNEA